MPPDCMHIWFDDMISGLEKIHMKCNAKSPVPLSSLKRKLSEFPYGHTVGGNIAFKQKLHCLKLI